MKNIKILGTGCPKCKQTTALVEALVKETGVEATIEKVEDIMDIMQYNIMATPAVVIDEKVAIKGRVPTRSELLELLG
ncbi:MAG: TM0996/MTH895 family glutaredoxin-like protein [Saprospiraceae bacterium]|nr:TM0996/MTH895 family glutaredoxin-like protein [Saprospiraceae bacterium]